MLDYTVPRRSQLNGKAGRINLSLLNRVRAMLHSAKLSHRFWGFAAQAAAYVINRSPTTTLENKSPAEMWYGVKPNAKNLVQFGSVIFTKNTKYLEGKKMILEDKNISLLDMEQMV